MRHLKYLSALMLTALLLSACNEYVEIDRPTPSAAEALVALTGTVDDLGLGGTTRSLFEGVPATGSDLSSVQPESFAPAWEEGDSLGTFGTEGPCTGYRYDATAAAFTGKDAPDVTLINAYYPFVKGATDPKAIPAVLPTTQVNDGTDTYYHAYDLCAGPVTRQADQDGYRCYSYRMYRPTTLMVAAIDFTDVDSLADEHIERIRYDAVTPLTGAFTMDITDYQPVLTPTAATANSVEVVFSQPQPLSQPVFAQVLVAPTAKKGDAITLTVTTSNYIIVVHTKVLTDFQPCCQHLQLSIVDYITLTRPGNDVTFQPNLPDSLFTLTALEDNVSITMNDGQNDQSLKYSIDGGFWKPLTFDTPIALAKGQQLQLSNTAYDGTTFSTYNKTYQLTSSTGKFNVSGKLAFLMDKWGAQSAFTQECAFTGLFLNTGVVDASALVLPATTYEKCYGMLFGLCKELTAAPVLPATTLSRMCYADMFMGCTSLTQTPVLPVTTLAAGCYRGMYSGCTSLTVAPALPATVLTDSCYMAMFKGCITLKQAPELPAKTIVKDGYKEMFNGCALLDSLVCGLDAIDTAHSQNWLMNTKGGGVLVANGTADWYGNRCASGLPESWNACVDLGLPSGTLWGIANVGATKRTASGCYFAWGECDPKANYAWSTYKWSEGDEVSLTKYCDESSYGYNGFTDDLTELVSADDVASKWWGTRWEMPIRAQLEELQDECAWTWCGIGNTEFNGTLGYKVQGQKEGYTDRYIFLPVAGSKINSSTDTGVITGCYWSKTRTPEMPQKAESLTLYSSTTLITDYPRIIGMSVRPVVAQ